MMQKRELYSRITSGSLVTLTALGLFTYLTFIPGQTFAEGNTEWRTLSDIDAMQEMTERICTNSKAEESKQLEDTREPGKKYWVTKLKDGNCWMTQNLDYNGLGSPQQVISSWNKLVSSAASNYYDPDAGSSGLYYYYTATNGAPFATGCSAGSTGLSACTSSGFKQQAMDIDTDYGRNLEHYRIGNYYSWEAAKTVCPTTETSQWQLPSYDNTANVSGSFGQLITDITANDVYKKPYYFTYGGWLGDSALNDAGYVGYYWSSTDNPSTSNSAVALYLNYNSIGAGKNAGTRYIGMSVRCLMIGGWTTPDIPPAQGSALISVTVSPVISLDVTKSANTNFDVDFTDVYTDTIITNVSSNYQYTVSISTEQTKLLPSDEDGHPLTTSLNYIPMIGTSVDGNGKNDVEKSVSGWGIKKKKSALSDTYLGETEDDDKYSPVGTTNPEVFYKSKGPEALTTDNPDTEPLTFTVGVGVSPNLPSGKYSTTITITASVI